MPRDALTRLREGNERFVANMPRQARTDSVRIRELATGQSPFACVLACSDSRVPVEFVFDQGVGDLFVVRTAGNTAGEHEVASLAYAVGGLGVPLVVVMGHTNCGAIRAALGEAPAPGEFGVILEEIRQAHAHVGEGDRRKSSLVADMVARAHVRDVISMLVERSETIAERIRAGSCGVIGAIYDTGSGRVTFLDDSETAMPDEPARAHAR